MFSSRHVKPFGALNRACTTCIVPGGATLTRRAFLGATATVIALTAGGTLFPKAVQAAKKSTQKLVKYQPTPKLNRKCVDCAFFLPGEKACKVVEGTIEPEGWCLRWAKKKS